MTGEDCILLAEMDRDNDGEKWLLDSDKGDSMVGTLIPWRICSSSSRNLEMTDPEPFLGPRRLRMMSLEQLDHPVRVFYRRKYGSYSSASVTYRRAEAIHLSQVSLPSHLTFRRRHWSQGCDFGGSWKGTSCGGATCPGSIANPQGNSEILTRILDQGPAS
jgi:hypothetical protein